MYAPRLKAPACGQSGGWGAGGGGVTPIMAYTGRIRPKGIYVSQASDVRKGRDFISCSI